MSWREAGGNGHNDATCISTGRLWWQTVRRHCREHKKSVTLGVICVFDQTVLNGVEVQVVISRGGCKLCVRAFHTVSSSTAAVPLTPPPSLIPPTPPPPRSFPGRGGGEEGTISTCHTGCLPAADPDWGAAWLHTDALLICMTGMLISALLPVKTQTANVGFRERESCKSEFQVLIQIFH